jgi:uncharacterized protein YjaG (DUF416 family)
MAIKEVSKLNDVDFTKQFVFAYLTCERLYPNYVYFSKHYHFGNFSILKSVIDYLHDNLFKKRINHVQIKSLIEKVEKNIPDPADYDTILASSALDTCTVLTESLNFLIDHDVSRLLDISSMATDTVHMYIQEIENLDFNTDRLFQQKIESHPLMIKEISIQKGIINYLLNIKNIEEPDIVTLLQLQENNKGTLNLSSI